jgi:hypothetical protein
MDETPYRKDVTPQSGKSGMGEALLFAERAAARSGGGKPGSN